MSTLEFGERIGKTAKLSPAVSTFIWNDNEKLLLTRRTDNGRWCLPGGRIEPGETVQEAAQRELLEETGFIGKVMGVVGVGSSPNMIYTYPDGNRWQGIEIDVSMKITGGEWTPSAETSQYGYFGINDLSKIDLMESEIWRVVMALTRNQAYVR